MEQHATLSRKAGNRLCRLHSVLENMRTGPRRASFAEYQFITRQLQRLVRKALCTPHAAAKACGALAVSLLLSGNADAQCNTFYNADAVNPVLAVKAPRIREPQFVDIDADGDLDCFAPRAVFYYSNPLFFKNTGTKAIPNYTYKKDDFGGFSSTGLFDLDFAPSTVRFADIDGDGDYDCFMSESYSFGDVHLRYFENQGTPATPKFVENEAKNPLRVSGSYFLTFSLADIDGDGDIDAYTYDWYFTYVYENVGTKTSPDFQYKESVRRSDAGDRTYVDWNKDGLVDYFEDTYNGSQNYFRNIGPKNDPQYVQDNQNGPQVENGFLYAVADLNGDGALEGFNGEGGYSTLAPVPAVDTSTVVIGGKRYTKFSISPAGNGYTYQAYRNGIPVKNGKFKTYIAPNDGVYSFTVTNSCGTGVSRPYKVAYSNAALDLVAKNGALSSVNSLVTATAYPNPFTDYVSVQLLSEATVQVTDLQGRILVNQTVGSGALRIGSNLAKGIYLLKVYQKDKVVLTQKLVKQ